MIFSVHLEEELFLKINSAAKAMGKTRNALIRQALGEWVADHKPAAWPAKVAAFKGIKRAPRFESGRAELKPPREPFDALSA